MTDSRITPKTVRRDSLFDKGVSWFTLAVIAVISYSSIPQILFLDSAFTQAKHSDHPLEFADYAQHSRRGPVVAKYRYLFASLSIAAPLCALAAMLLCGWRRDTVLGVCVSLALAVYFYVGMAIIFAT